MMKNLTIASLVALTYAVPALASVNVNSPSNGSNVSSSFTLSANSSTCSSQNVSAMGYSFDGSAETTIIDSTSINTQVTTTTGSHTLHVKAWGDHGDSCVADVAINVTSSSGGPSSVVPSGAASNSNIETMNNWSATYDGTTGGSAWGSMSLVSSPAQNGDSRQFYTSFTNHGGMRYSVGFGDDNSSANFFYDAWVYLGANANQIGNLEMDMNQTMQNGQTAIFGFQCDGYTSTWDYTKNGGSPSNPSDQWVHSNAYCNPRGWSTYAWHHVQIYYSRDDSGNITYHTVWLDGNQQNINATVNSAFALGWAPRLVTNFQVDGYGSSGSPTVFLDNVTLYRW